DVGQFPLPLQPILLDQLALAQPQSNLAGVPFRQARPLDLHADEFGTGAIALLLQPVGDNKPRRVIIGMSRDVFEKASGQVVAHGKRSRIGPNRSATSATTWARFLGVSCPPQNLTKSCQRAEDVFMDHHESRPKSARASADVFPRLV